MTASYVTLLKALSPSVATKAISTFDRLTLLIVSLCWATTIVVMLFAIYTVNLSLGAKKAVEATLATEPTLPRISRSGVGGKELQTVIDRLKNSYPALAVTWQKNVLTVAATNGGLYHQWLTAIGQLDTIYPQIHWTIKNLCIGQSCGGQYLMSVDVAGEKVSLEIPQKSEKK